MKEFMIPFRVANPRWKWDVSLKKAAVNLPRSVPPIIRGFGVVKHAVLNGCLLYICSRELRATAQADVLPSTDRI